MNRDSFEEGFSAGIESVSSSLEKKALFGAVKKGIEVAGKAFGAAKKLGGSGLNISKKLSSSGANLAVKAGKGGMSMASTGVKKIAANPKKAAGSALAAAPTVGSMGGSGGPKPASNSYSSLN